MIDFLLGGALVVLLFRGWMRGLIREAIGLFVVVVGTLLAFQLSTAAGAVVSAMAGTGADASRFIGGIVVFLLVSVGGAIAAHVAHRGVRFLPGLPTADRLGGAAFGGIAGVLVATVVLSALVLMPLPPAWRAQLDASTTVSFLVEPEGTPQAALGVVAGDRVAGTVLALQDVIGERRLVGGARSVALPPTRREELVVAGGASDRVYGLLNESRVDMGVDPLARSRTLDGVARALALDVYTSGRFAVAADVEARVEAAGVPVVDAAQVLGLGVTAPSVHEGLLEDSTAARTLGGGYRRMGVAAVGGPLGLITVVVLTE